MRGWSGSCAPSQPPPAVVQREWGAGQLGRSPGDIVLGAPELVFKFMGADSGPAQGMAHCRWCLVQNAAFRLTGAQWVAPLRSGGPMPIAP